MKSVKPINNLLSLAQTRFRRARSGSVLLIVVILLLMLTILGTAFVSTSHSDRISSDQGVKNAQSDLTAQTIADTVIAKMQQDLNDPSAPQMYAGNSGTPLGNSYKGNFRGKIAYRGDFSNLTSPATYYYFGDVVRDSANPTRYYTYINTVPTAGSAVALPLFGVTSNYWKPINLMGPGNDTAFGTTDDTGGISLSGITSSYTQPWLADRIPSYDAATNAYPYWQNIGQPLLYSGTFESPEGSTLLAPNSTYTPGYSTYVPSGGSTAGRLYPGYGILNGQIVPLLGTVPPSQYVDAMGNPQNPLQFPLPSSPTPSPMIGKVSIAGDADGDGIGDSLLQRIPGMYADGLTWYAASRVVDNNAAINVNTAWGRDGDFDATGAETIPNSGLFLSGVGLSELPLSDPIAPFNQYRFNGAPSYPMTNPVDDSKFVPNPNGVSPPIVADSLRGDMAFISQGDAFQHQSIRRLNNPALIYLDRAATAQNPQVQYQRYEPLTATDSASLAYHFCLVNPLTQNSVSSAGSLLEKYLPLSTWNVGPRPSGQPIGQPYGQTQEAATRIPLDPLNWWLDNFAWDYKPAGSTYNYGDVAYSSGYYVYTGSSTSSGPPGSGWVSMQGIDYRSLLVAHNATSNYVVPAYNPDPGHPGETINPAMLTYGPNRATNRIQYRANVAQTGVNFVYNDGQNYQVDDAVTYSGSTYISLQDNNTGHFDSITHAPDITPATATTVQWWGRLGIDQGQWSSAATYNPGDIVHLNGLTFVSTGTNTNAPPSPVGQYTTRANPAAANSVPAIIFTPNPATSPYHAYDVNLSTHTTPPAAADSHWLRPPQYMGAYDGSWDTVGTPANTIYGQGDIVLNDVANGGDGFTYICVAPNDPTTGYVDTTTTGGVAPGGMTVATLESTPTIWQLQPYSAQPTKANANTATFRELFRAYWNVMAGTQGNLSPFGDYANPVTNTTGTPDYNPYDWQGSAATPAAAAGTGNPQHMFRSSLRDPHTIGSDVTRMDYNNMMQLRAALAAVNTLSERDGSQNVISRTVPLMATIPPTGVFIPQTVQARVYSSVPQPFISEIYADTDTTADDPNAGAAGNPAGYVAIELFNPYSFPLVLNNWQVAYINRAAHPNMTILNTGIGQMVTVANVSGMPTDQAPGVVVIPSHGYALLENYNAAAPGAVTTDAVFRPHAGGFATGVEPAGAATGVWTGPVGGAVNSVDVWVSGLQNVFNNEMVILRPRRVDGVFTRWVDLTNSQNPENYDEGTVAAPNLVDLVPIDSYDFTGLAGVAPNFPEWAYIRQKGGTSATNLFKSTYPGRYDATAAIGTPRQEGTATALIVSPGGMAEPAWSVTNGAQVPATSGVNPPIATWGADFNYATYTNIFPAIQVYNCYGPGPTGAPPYMPMHWPNAVNYPKINTAAVSPTPILTNGNNGNPVVTNAFPFGGIPRNGDLLDVMYMGAYRIITTAQSGTYTKNYLSPPTVTTVTGADVAPATFVEMNSLPMDCSFADDGAIGNISGAYNAGTTYSMGNVVYDPANPQNYYQYVNTTPAAGQPLAGNPTYWQLTQPPDAYENIGRFCPMQSAASGVSAAGDNYAWARNLFNYITVQNYNDDYLPNVDPSPNDPQVSNVNTTPAGASPTMGMDYKVTDSTNNGALNANPNRYPGAQPSKVFNNDGTATNQVNQHNVGVEGLININTADWKTLSMLPMVYIAPTDPNYIANKPTYDADNELLAKLIVTWRAAHGPFLSIFDLNQVTDGAGHGFQNAWGTFLPATTSPSSEFGSLCPPDIAFPGYTVATPVSSTVVGDFAANNLILTRISNLITTHSDNFTVYVEIQGWQNAVVPGATVGTPGVAFPKITRRYAVIVDRSQMSIDPTTHYPKTIVVPNN